MNFVLMGFERRGEWGELPPEAERQRRIREHQEGRLPRSARNRRAEGEWDAVVSDHLERTRKD